MTVYTVTHLEARISHGRILEVTSGIFSHGLMDRPAARAATKRLAKDKCRELVRSGACSPDDIRIETGQNGFKVCWDDAYDEYVVTHITVKEG